MEAEQMLAHKASEGARATLQWLAPQSTGVAHYLWQEEEGCK